MERAGWTAARSAETGRTPDAPRSLSRTDRAARTPDLPMMARGGLTVWYRRRSTLGEGSKQRAFLSVASSALPERCTQTPASLHTLALACRRSLALVLRFTSSLTRSLACSHTHISPVSKDWLHHTSPLLYWYLAAHTFPLSLLSP